MLSKEHPTAWITGIIERFLIKSPLNNLQNEDNAPAWDDVLVGFASGADPLFQKYKEYIGPFHWTPLEIYNQYHPGSIAIPEELTVISWVLPQRKVVRDMNRKARKFPAEEWARVRIEGEKFNAGLRAHIAKTLTDKGYPAVAPILAPNWAWVNSKNYGYASSWSERHAAYAAGLGTFGLCDGLITPKGKAMRAGSLDFIITIALGVLFLWMDLVVNVLTDARFGQLLLPDTIRKRAVST